MEAKGQKMLENYYECQCVGSNAFNRGLSVLMGHNARGHPSAEDLSAARKWAKELAEAA